MPVKLREFYWNELLGQKEAETKAYSDIMNKSKSSSRSGITSKR
jgi:hypothetical protein